MTQSCRNTARQCFFRFDLDRGRVAAKAYLAPIRALQTGEPAITVASRGITSLEGEQLRFPAYHQLLHYMATNSEGSILDFLGLAVDCVDPQSSRLKLYFRSPHTSLDSVFAVLTMGGQSTSFQSVQVMEDFSQLWRSTLGLDDNSPSNQELPQKDHATSGVLYNFDVMAGKPMPEPKVYIPVRHYGQNDLRIAQGLTAFLKGQGKGSACFVENYMRMLEVLCKHRRLESDCGLQTYISCSVKNDSLSITSYMSPEIYHKSRWLESSG